MTPNESTAIITPLSTPKPHEQSLRGLVKQSLERYFLHLDGQPTFDLYNMVLEQVEGPLLEVVMHEVRGNQSKAAEILGINRGTLRKKLKQYDLIEN